MRGTTHLEELAGRVFGRSDAHPTGPANEAEWIRVFGRHFLNAASYNAAKHGMALGGGAEQRTLTVDEREVFQAKGSAVSWLAQWPLNQGQRPRRWTRASRLFSVEAYIVMIETAALLMESVWTHGRALHLNEVDDGVEYRPLPPPNVLFKAMGIPSHVLAEQYEPLAYENENSELIMRISFPPHATDDDQLVQDG